MHLYLMFGFLGFLVVAVIAFSLVLHSVPRHSERDHAMRRLIATEAGIVAAFWLIFFLTLFAPHT